MEPEKAQVYTTQIVQRSAVDDKAWNDFIAESPQGAPYGCTWYLDAVWPGWKGVLVLKNRELAAVMPFRVSRKYGISYIFNPPFCQYLGIFLSPPGSQKREKELSLKKRLTCAALSALPKDVKLFILNFAPEFDYPFPFYWEGYELHTRYSYWLENDQNKDALFKKLHSTPRNYINKARRHGLKAVYPDSPEALIRLGQKKGVPAIDYGALQDLWPSLIEQGIGKTIEIRDAQNRLQAGVVYLQWKNKFIYLYSVSDPEFVSLGGMSLAIWKMIEQAGEEIKVIDFEGSMIESIEHFFRSFGGAPVPYLQIKKNSFPKPFRWIFQK